MHNYKPLALAVFAALAASAATAQAEVAPFTLGEINVTAIKESSARLSNNTITQDDMRLFNRETLIAPYTDLLLHDMGQELADGRPDFKANGNEWRTPPLWGIGLAKKVDEQVGFLHDGRARNLLEAILWHGGEAEASREQVRTMSAQDRQALMLFLESL